MRRLDGKVTFITFTARGIIGAIADMDDIIGLASINFDPRLLHVLMESKPQSTSLLARIIYPITGIHLSVVRSIAARKFSVDGGNG